MTKISTVLLSIMVLMLSSCNSTKKIVYLQDKQLNVPENITNFNTIKIQPGDEISIVVSCKDPESAMLFNLLQVNNRIGQTSSSATWWFQQQCQRPGLDLQGQHIR